MSRDKIRNIIGKVTSYELNSNAINPMPDKKGYVQVDRKITYDWSKLSKGDKMFLRHMSNSDDSNHDILEDFMRWELDNALENALLGE